MFSSKLKALKKDNIFYVGLFIFVVQNIFSAATTGVHFDEAYYWLYSQQPALGYFDHPPVVSLLIFIGRNLMGGTMGLRLMTVVLSTISITLLWDMIKTYGNRPLLFWSIIYAIFLIHPYSFVATPDAPLFFFSILFFYSYKKFLEKSSFANIFLLALSTSLMIYSKYHGVLVAGFVILSNLKLLKEKRFWYYALLVIVFLTPHLIWQYNNDWVSFKYHLIDRQNTPYSFLLSVEYIVVEFFLMGGFISWLLLPKMFGKKPQNEWEKGLKWMGIGILVFFLFSTSGGRYEAHWTLVATIPLVILSYSTLCKTNRWNQWIHTSGAVTLFLIITARIVLTTSIANNVKAFSLFHGWDKDARELQAHVNDHPVVFQDEWHRASRFAFYTQNPEVININSAQYRKNQFNVWNKDEELIGETVYVVSKNENQFENPNIVETEKETWYINKINNFRSYYNLSFDVRSFKHEDKKIKFEVKLNNPYPEDIATNDSTIQASFQIRQYFGNQWYILQSDTLHNFTIKDGTICNPQFEFDYDIPYKSFLVLTFNSLEPIPSIFRIDSKLSKQNETVEE
ncbi:MAG: glycosyltransferase family 39 protein [Prolixibacteraceae bacterium]|nr:glycosyltransferase family 39 protein [Prolixibacteraceae bacterium]